MLKDNTFVRLSVVEGGLRTNGVICPGHTQHTAIHPLLPTDMDLRSLYCTTLDDEYLAPRYCPMLIPILTSHSLTSSNQSQVPLNAKTMRAAESACTGAIRERAAGQQGRESMLLCVVVLNIYHRWPGTTAVTAK